MDGLKDVMFSWIEASIRYSGRFSAAEKSAYREVFRLSEATVSRHQVEFLKIFEGHCEDAVFEKDGSGRPKGGRLELKDGALLPAEFVFMKVPSMHRWLSDALGSARYLDAENQRADPKPWVLRCLVSAMLSRKAILIRYWSRTRESERIISPLVLVRVVGRLHVRAFDHMSNEARDFVLSRISHAEIQTDTAFCDKDPDWHIMENLIISEIPDIGDKPDRTGIRLDFALDQNGQRSLKMRRPIVHYLVDLMDPSYASPVRIEKPD